MSSLRLAVFALILAALPAAPARADEPSPDQLKAFKDRRQDLEKRRKKLSKRLKKVAKVAQRQDKALGKVLAVEKARLKELADNKRRQEFLEGSPALTREDQITRETSLTALRRRAEFINRDLKSLATQAKVFEGSLDKADAELDSALQEGADVEAKARALDFEIHRGLMVERFKLGLSLRKVLDEAKAPYDKVRELFEAQKERLSRRCALRPSPAGKAWIIHEPARATRYYLVAGAEAIAVFGFDKAAKPSNLAKQEADRCFKLGLEVYDESAVTTKVAKALAAIRKVIDRIIDEHQDR